MSVYLIIAIGYLLYVLIRSIKRPANFPPGPQFLPWVGNTLQLRKKAVAEGGQHVALESWSKEFKSDILGLKLGNEFVVYVRSYALVHDVHLQEVFEGRPDNFFLRLRTMGSRKGITCTDGKLWYEHRNFSMKQMRHVGYGRTEMEQHIKLEINSLLRYLNSLKGESVWPGNFLAPSVINVLWSLTAGKRFERNDKRLVRLLDLMNRRSKAFTISGGVMAQYPWLRYLAPNKCGYNLICQLNKELHNFFMETIEQHKRDFTAAHADSDFIYSYLHEMQNCDEQNSTTFNETQLTMTILDFFIAGSQTTSTTMDLALMVLALKQDMQQQIFEEIQAVMGKKEECPALSQRNAFPQTDAFLMEIQRYFSIVPVTGPRRALWHTKLAGYDIPKNTTILIGVGAVHKEEKYWSEANEFLPERFIDEEGKTFKNEFFMPFGQGRRRCLGDMLARACIFSFLIKIMQNFKIVTTDIAEEQPSLKLLPGITLSARPYKIKFIARD